MPIGKTDLAEIPLYLVLPFVQQQPSRKYDIEAFDLLPDEDVKRNQTVPQDLDYAFPKAISSISAQLRRWDILGKAVLAVLCQDAITSHHCQPAISAITEEGCVPEAGGPEVP